MREVKHNGHTIVMQDSIDELPIERFIAFNRHLMIEAAIGGTVSDYDQRLRRAEGFVSRGDKKNALVELTNARNTVRNCINGLSPSMMAFAVLVESIDGEPVKSYDELGLKRIITKLSATKTAWGKLESWMRSAKKKIDGETTVFFNNAAISTDEIAISKLLKKRTEKMLTGVIEGSFSFDSPDIVDIDLDLLLFFEPRMYAGKDSAEISYVKSYENLVASIGKWLGYDPAGFTTLRFYQSVEMARQSQKKNSKR